jgi:3-oxoacyl-[acyl-carrier protein] reductase
MRTALTYAHSEEAVAHSAEACARYGGDVRTAQLDLRSPADVDRLTQQITAEWGSLHALVDNAGCCPYTAYNDIDVDEWDMVLETNARGTFLMCRGALELLRAADGDRAIVNVSSIAGQIGGVTTSVHYAASKAAILAITRSFARLLAAEGIRVNAVAPGPIATGITDSLGAEAREVLTHSVPLGGFGQPEDVAHTIALLAGPESAYTTGSTYGVNGGFANRLNGRRRPPLALSGWYDE